MAQGTVAAVHRGMLVSSLSRVLGFLCCMKRVQALAGVAQWVGLKGCQLILAGYMARLQAQSPGACRGS